MKRYFEIALGIVTSIGGFLEAGSIATAAQAGADFRFRLLWPILLGTILLVFLTEMAGRLAAVSHHPLPAAVRERFGFTFFVIPLVATTVVDLLVLAAEIGGACVALQLLTGIAFPWFAIPVAALVWALLWFGTFGSIEYGVSLLGLITIAFAVAAIELHPDWPAAARGLVPSFPRQGLAHYAFLAVSILGATISPYLFNFYSSGAVEDQWTIEDLAVNRVTSAAGMGFGGLMSMAVLVCAAVVLFPGHIAADRYDRIALTLQGPFGRAGRDIFAAALFIACLGAALELSLDCAYVYAQSFGWSWGENKKPADAARFAFVFTLLIAAAAVLVVVGINPLKLTIFSMALTAVALPIVVLPFLVLMNDDRYLGEYRNGAVGNTVVFACIVLAAVVAVVSIPLEIFGGS